jgi:hypothetical protein
VLCLRRTQMRFPDLAQELFYSSTAPNLSLCFLLLKTPRVAGGGALWTLAVHNDVGERRPRRQDGRIDRTTRRLTDSVRNEVGYSAIFGDAVEIPPTMTSSLPISGALVPRVADTAGFRLDQALWRDTPTRRDITAESATRGTRRFWMSHSSSARRHRHRSRTLRCDAPDRPPSTLS